MPPPDLASVLTVLLELLAGENELYPAADVAADAHRFCHEAATAWRAAEHSSDEAAALCRWVLERSYSSGRLWQREASLPAAPLPGAQRALQVLRLPSRLADSPDVPWDN